MTIDLTGKRAIVTGASRGLGAAIVARMELAGAEVWGTTRENANFLLDADPALKLWKARTPGTDILVNCAGIQGPVRPIDEAWAFWSQWDDCRRVNLDVPVMLCMLAVRDWKATKTPSSIINISGGGACNPRPGYSAYATSKAGLVRFSETIAEECKPYGIRVNCVSPGDLGPMGREKLPNFGTNEMLAAECVCWLASDASRPITGKLISAIWDPWPELERNLAKSEDMYTLRRVVP